MGYYYSFTASYFTSLVWQVFIWLPLPRRLCVCLGLFVGWCGWIYWTNKMMMMMMNSREILGRDEKQLITAWGELNLDLLASVFTLTLEIRTLAVSACWFSCVFTRWRQSPVLSRTRHPGLLSLRHPVGRRSEYAAKAEGVDRHVAWYTSPYLWSCSVGCCLLN